MLLLISHLNKIFYSVVFLFLQSSIIIPFSIEKSFLGIFYEFVEAAFKKFGLILLDLDSINSDSLV